METELASALERMAGVGNTLSAVLRQAWDGEKLDTLVKANRATAAGARVSVIGHITAEELRRKLTATRAGERICESLPLDLLPTLEAAAARRKN